MNNITRIMDRESRKMATAMVIDMMTELHESKKLDVVSYMKLDSFKQETACFKVDGVVIISINNQKGYVNVDVEDFTTEGYGSQTYKFKVRESLPCAVKLMELVREYGKNEQINNFKDAVKSILKSAK